MHCIYAIYCHIIIKGDSTSSKTLEQQADQSNPDILNKPTEHPDIKTADTAGTANNAGIVIEAEPSTEDESSTETDSSTETESYMETETSTEAETTTEAESITILPENLPKSGVIELLVENIVTRNT